MERITSLSSMFKAVGAYAAGKMSEDDVMEYENKTCPTMAHVQACIRKLTNCLYRSLAWDLEATVQYLPYLERTVLQESRDMP